MKKHLICIILLLTCVATFAQYQKGDLFVYPRIGFSLANVSPNDLYFGFQDSDLRKSKRKAGLAIGVEAERFMNSILSLSAGILYANQGYRYADWGEQDRRSDTFANVEDMHSDMQYIGLPLLLNGYLAERLALKVGIQPAWLIKAQSHRKESSGIIENESNYVVNSSETIDENTTDLCHRMDFSVPVGMSYEYKHIVIDLRYNIGLTKAFKHSADGRNNAIVVTLGYQIEP